MSASAARRPDVPRVRIVGSTIRIDANLDIGPLRDSLERVTAQDVIRFGRTLTETLEWACEDAPSFRASGSALSTLTFEAIVDSDGFTGGLVLDGLCQATAEIQDNGAGCGGVQSAIARGAYSLEILFEVLDDPARMDVRLELGLSGESAGVGVDVVRGDDVDLSNRDYVLSIDLQETDPTSGVETGSVDLEPGKFYQLITQGHASGRIDNFDGTFSSDMTAGLGVTLSRVTAP